MPIDRMPPRRKSTRPEWIGSRSGDTGLDISAAALLLSDEETEKVRKKVVERLGGDVYERIGFIVALLDQNNPRYDQIVTVALVMLAKYFPRVQRKLWDAIKLDEEELRKLVGDRVSLLSKIHHQMCQHDSEEDHSARIEVMYNEGTPEQKRVLDDFTICLCGWSLETLMRQRGLGVMKDEQA